MSLTKNSARAGLGLQASYTFSKSIDDTSSVISSSIAGAGVVLQTPPQDPWNPQRGKRRVHLRRHPRLHLELDSAAAA